MTPFYHPGLLPHLPRQEIRHEPENIICGCGCAMKRIGEDIAEKLDYRPGVFTVERHVRGKWVCPECQTLVQAPGWTGRLVTNDFSGCKACYEIGVTEVGCTAHARRKFHELWANHGSQVGEQALKFFVKFYDVERDVHKLTPEERKTIRRERARPIADALHQWLTQQRQKVPDGSATAKAIDYSLKRWVALTRHIDDGDLPIDNNWVENQIRPIAIGKSNWLFAGSLRAGKRAAAIMSLVHSARLNGHDPYTYLRDILERLPMQQASRIAELLPHRWMPWPIK